MAGECGLKVCGDKKYYCTVELTLQVIGGKWKPIIIYRLAKDGTLRFSEIKRAIPNITQKMLTQQLRELEADGIVHREVYPQVPPKVEYSMTELGQTIVPVIHSLCQWGERYRDEYGKQTAQAEAV
ncbi:helix-turn-helix domain-containing protein [Pseudodesulfovibrio sp. zrk46]|uniref:winged helix-turn-helix transcriptional regulator n=1 Tax=Pseudodesulfovibrio sp. zrk46 TaxID=2725288 RepID=UPI00144920E3|nr:helix-turn-helix domain-containing protein [Pseudodesulfovibrio sp. zrk46]QJB55768.1 helix-turn-helix transcriptional regulator [Pseudodesulfovibrio sp. zrk46]